MQPYLIVIIVVAALIVLLFAFALICENMAFGKRCDKNPLLKYFTAEDFELTARSVSLPNGLNGFVYRKENVPDNGRLIIFCHGMGAGHIAYTTEIAYFGNCGFSVLAVDNKGCNLSQGKSIKGMYSGVQTAVSVIDFARNNQELKEHKIFLVGHSWGAYSALCASAERRVDGVVAISSPISPVKAMQEASARIISKPIATILKPFWWLINFFKFGLRGNSDAAVCARKNSTPTLIVHGDCDKIISLSTSVLKKAEGGNLTKLCVSGKGHNPYNTQNAEKCLAQLSGELKNGKKDFSDFDFKAATEEDMSVMQGIFDFIIKI